MSKLIEYKLKKPIVVGNDRIDILKFREPAMKHLKKLDGITGDIARTAKLIEVLAEILPAYVDEISAEDIKEIGKIIEGFF